MHRSQKTHPKNTSESWYASCMNRADKNEVDFRSVNSILNNFMRDVIIFSFKHGSMDSVP